MPVRHRGESLVLLSNLKRQSHWRPKAAASGTQIRAPCLTIAPGHFRTIQDARAPPRGTQKAGGSPGQSAQSSSEPRLYTRSQPATKANINPIPSNPSRKSPGSHRVKFIALSIDSKESIKGRVQTQRSYRWRTQHPTLWCGASFAPGNLSMLRSASCTPHGLRASCTAEAIL